MRKITVTYLLSDEEIKRLEIITKEYKKQQGLDTTIDRIFESIMCCGGKYDIERKFALHEEILKIKNKTE